MKNWLATLAALLLKLSLSEGYGAHRRLVDPSEGASANGENNDGIADNDIDQPRTYTQADIEKMIADAQAAVRDDDDDKKLYYLLIAICAGILLAIFTVGVCHFVVALKKESKQPKPEEDRRVRTATEPTTSNEDEELGISVDHVLVRKKKKFLRHIKEDSGHSVDSHRPISHVRLGGSSAAHQEGRGVDDASSLAEQSVDHSVNSNLSIFSYMRGLRRAALQLGGFQAMFHVREKDNGSRSHTTIESSNDEEEGDDRSLSSDSFSSESDDEEGDEQGGDAEEVKVPISFTVCVDDMSSVLSYIEDEDEESRHRESSAFSI